MALGIIEPVLVSMPTTHCSKMEVALKKDSSPRHTVDLQKLNAATLRETHHTPSTIQLGVASTSAHQKDCLRCMEWLP